MRRLSMAPPSIISASMIAGGAPAVSPDIKANGAGGTVTIPRDGNIFVTVGVDPEGASGHADWWLVADTPFGRYSYDASAGTWIPGLRAAYEGPLFDLPPTEVLNVKAELYAEPYMDIADGGWTHADADPHEPEVPAKGNMLVCLQRESPCQVSEIKRSTGEIVWQLKIKDSPAERSPDWFYKAERIQY